MASKAHLAIMLNRRSITLSIACLGLLLISGFVGCEGRPDEYCLATGEFSWEDGAPLTGVRGLVRFSPIKERHERASSTGELRSDGSFELSTYETQYGKLHKGLRPGEYNVVLLEYDRADKPRIIPENYRHFEESPWRATVLAEDINHFRLVVERREEQAPE